MTIISFKKEKIYFSVVLCVVFFGLIFSFVFAKPSFEVAPTSEPTVAAATVVPANQITGGNVIITAQITDVSGIASAKIDIKDSTNVTKDTVFMYDDGFSNDGAAKDGVFGVQWNIPGSFPAGVYKVFIIATDTLGNTLNPAVEQTTFTVTAAPPVLTTIIITPNNPTLVVSQNQTFTAFPKDQFGNPIAAVINWTSSAPAIGTIVSGTGVFTALAAGTTTISAKSGTVTGTSYVVVAAPVLTTIDIVPLNPTFSVGQTQIFVASSKDQVGNPIAAVITWTSSAPINGTIVSNTGLFTAVATGTTTITAISGVVSGTTTVTINTAVIVLTSIDITPVNPTITVGGSQTFTAYPKDQFGNPMAVAIVWTSSAPAVGTIGGGSGIFTAVAPGTTTVSAKSGAITGSTTVTVTVVLPLVVSISSPSPGEFRMGETINFTASAVTGGVAPYTYSWVSTYSLGSLFFPAPLDGNIGTTASFSKNNLLPNRDARDITLTVTDSVGTTATSVVKISVYYPTAVIQTPAAGSTFNQILDDISFQALSCGSKLPCTYTWLSNIDGNIGNLQSFQKNDLTLGAHTITLKVVDAWAQISTTTININVVNPASLTAKISAPVSDFYPVGASVTFDSRVAGGPAPYTYSWTSNIDGAIGNTKTFSKNNLSVGTHTITLTVTDAASATDTKSITLQIIGCTSLFGDQVSPSKLDIVFVGANYTLAQMPQFVTDVTTDKNKLFSTAPFNTPFYQNKINVHYVKYAGDLGCSITTVGPDKYLHCDSAKAAIVAAVCPNDQVAVISNLDSAAIGSADVNSGLLFASNSTWMFVHEFGHAFGGLEDEFDYGSNSPGNADPLPFPGQPNCDKAGCPKWSAIPGGCSGLGNVLTCTDTGLTNGTTYYYQAAAVNANGTGSLLGAVEMSVVPGGAAPTAPSPVAALTATAGDAQITVAWAVPSSGGSAITSYKVYRSITSGTEVLLGAGACSGLGNVLSCTDIGLTNGTTYYYKAAAVNSVGTGSLVGALEASAMPAVVTNAPSPVAVLSATIGDAQTTLTWSAPADGGSVITSYNVYRSTTSGAEALLGAGACSGLGNVLTCTDTGLINGTKYYYQVAAVNAIGTGSLFGATESSVVPVLTATAPNPVAVLSTVPGNTKATLSWVAPAPNGSPITSYLIYRSTVPGAEISLGAGVVCSATCTYSNWFKSSLTSVMRSMSADYFNLVSSNYLVNNKLSAY